MITLAQIIVMIGFAFGLTGAWLTIKSPPLIKETWDNIPQWSLGLKLMVSGILIWIIGLIVV